MMAPFFSTSPDELFCFPSEASTLSAGCVPKVGEVTGSSERVEKVSGSGLATTQRLPMGNGFGSTNNILNPPSLVIASTVVGVVLGLEGRFVWPLLSSPCPGDGPPCATVPSAPVVASPVKSWLSHVVGYTGEINVVDGKDVLLGLVVVVTSGVKLDDVEASVGIGSEVDATIPLMSTTSPNIKSASCTIDDRLG